MVFKPRQKKENLNIKQETTQCTIDQVKESMSIGVILNENLSWKPHIANIARKVHWYNLQSYGLCLPTSTLCTLYYSLVHPYLLDCITVWGSTYPSTLKRIVLLQKKVVQIISRSIFNAHTEPTFKQLKTPNLYSIYRFQIGKIMFLFKISRLLDALKKLFWFSSSNYCYYTKLCDRRFVLHTH